MLIYYNYVFIYIISSVTHNLNLKVWKGNKCAAGKNFQILLFKLRIDARWNNLPLRNIPPPNRPTPPPPPPPQKKKKSNEKIIFCNCPKKSFPNKKFSKALHFSCVLDMAMLFSISEIISKYLWSIFIFPFFYNIFSIRN